MTYSQSPAGGLSWGDNVCGNEAVLCCIDDVCAVQLLITTVGNEKVRLTETEQTNCKAASETCCLKNKKGFQLCSNFKINLRIEQSLSSCHAELGAETLQRRRRGGGGTTDCRTECIKNISTALKLKFEAAIYAHKFNKMLTV